MSRVYNVYPVGSRIQDMTTVHSTLPIPIQCSTYHQLVPTTCCVSNGLVALLVRDPQGLPMQD
jgi:secreted Zn-dependent insulinase-like peptidase